MADDKVFFDTDTEQDTDRSVGPTHSVASRNNLRQQLQAQIEEFLAKGGTIAHLPPNARAESVQIPDTDLPSFD